MSEYASHELIALLGEHGFIALAQAFGGTRLSIPQKIDSEHEIYEAVGEKNAARLADRYAGAQIRVPLARDARARHYRAGGLSNAKIARRLGMSETGVEKLFARMDSPPEKGSAQLTLDI